LPGNFRSSDIRWHPDIRRIEQILLKPGFPPMYLISDDEKLVARTKNQLQVVKKNERAPDIKYIRNNADTAIIEKIIDKRKNGRKDEYLVKWKGYPDAENSWIDLKQLNRTADLRMMKDEFNANND
jgi:hypothetical protein